VPRYEGLVLEYTVNRAADDVCSRWTTMLRLVEILSLPFLSTSHPLRGWQICRSSLSAHGYLRLRCCLLVEPGQTSALTRTNLS